MVPQSDNDDTKAIAILLVFSVNSQAKNGDPDQPMLFTKADLSPFSQIQNWSKLFLFGKE